MRHKIENEYIAVEAITKGAEAKSMVMKETGKDLPSIYKETSIGGLAKQFGE